MRKVIGWRLAGVALLCSLTLGAAAAAETVNMLSLQQGALPLVVPPSYGGWEAESLLDDSPKSGWACETGNITDNVFVFELVEQTTFERFEFDTAAIDTEQSGAKDILVEVSAESAQAGFTPVLQVSLAEQADGQSFAAAKKAPARWVRLTLKNNHGSAEWTELFAFRGFGEKPPMKTPTNISGTYDTSFSKFHLLQKGASLSGCYEYDEGLLDGTIEGRVMKLSWRESDGRGPAVMVMAPDGNSFRGFYWQQDKAKEAPSGIWDGKKIGAQVGGCPHWSGSVGGELKKQLGNEKRARVYGILFDVNSATIKTESKAVLDEVLALLDSEPEWRLTIEGHTDAVGSDERNQALSKQRADAVKAYLVSGGIAAERLKTAGLGESAPVADNTTELGRAQNRRVELVRE